MIGRSIRHIIVWRIDLPFSGKTPADDCIICVIFRINRTYFRIICTAVLGIPGMCRAGFMQRIMHEKGCPQIRSGPRSLYVYSNLDSDTQTETQRILSIGF